MRFSLKPSTPQVVIGTLGSTVLSLFHSLQTQGPQRTAVFAGLGLSIPIAAEFVGVNIARALRHHTQPQAFGVPLAAALGWYNITYATFGVVERLSHIIGVLPSQRRWALPLGTALVATSLDLVLDCYGLDQGLWEWTEDGVYATDITGPNGKQGIPLENFVGWLVLTSGVTGSYLALTGTDTHEVAQSDQSGRTAALMLLPYYMIGVVWAVQQRKPQYLLSSALVPIAIGLALAGDRRK
jgi:uncharacterized membrane protein